MNGNINNTQIMPSVPLSFAQRKALAAEKEKAFYEKNKIMATAKLQKTQQNTDITNDINNTSNGAETFKERKKNAKIKKAIGIILLILATLAIIGAIFFLYKACKSRHDAVEAEKNNPKHETLKKQINAENDTVNTLNDKLTAQKNSNEITFSENGKDYKAVFDKETKKQIHTNYLKKTTVENSVKTQLKP